MEFSENIVTFLAEKFPEADIYSMSLEELKAFRDEVALVRNEYSLLELAMKTLGNAAYGASANHAFYFYNVKLAGDITGECRILTKTMWHKLDHFLHEEIWLRKDLWEQFGFELDESKHDWYRQQPVSIYSDTDSIAKNSSLLIRRNGKIITTTIAELFKHNYCLNQAFSDDTSGKEITASNDEVLNWTKEKGLHFVPISWIMKHKVSKAQFKITTKSGKVINVTGDHSCIVFRNGEQIEIKAKDINKNTDKILVVKDLYRSTTK